MQLNFLPSKELEETFTLINEAKNIGFPIMIKAVRGGGGKVSLFVRFSFLTLIITFYAYQSDQSVEHFVPHIEVYFTSFIILKKQVI